MYYSIDWLSGWTPRPSLHWRSRRRRNVLHEPATICIVISWILFGAPGMGRTWDRYGWSAQTDCRGLRPSGLRNGRSRMKSEGWFSSGVFGLALDPCPDMGTRVWRRPGGLSVRTGNDRFPPKALGYENCGQNHAVTDSAHDSNLVSYGWFLVRLSSSRLNSNPSSAE